MSILTKGMYSDINCKVFGLVYDQRRTDAIIRNAGWFNAAGERLGTGDLSYKDICKILDNIDENDMFIALSEADSQWDIPSNIDRNAPGIKYCLDKAIWVVSYLNDHFNAYHIKHSAPFKSKNIVVFKNDKDQYDEIEIVEISRNLFYQDIDFNGDVILSLKETPMTIRVEPRAHYGLDVHYLTDGKAWAIGSPADLNKAILSRARSLIWSIDIDTIKYFIRMSDSEYSMIDYLKREFGVESNGFIITLLGNPVVDALCDHYVKSYTVAQMISLYDGKEYYSSTIKGLPKNYYAYRVS